MCVIRWRATIALLLALLYLPATGHCLLETAGLLPSGGDCCEQTSSPDGSSTIPCVYGCCPSEYAVHFSPANDGVLLLVAEVPVVVVVLPLEVLPQRSLVVPPESSPPDLPTGWQFSFRTALPPRAPSFVS